VFARLGAARRLGLLVPVTALYEHCPHSQEPMKHFAVVTRGIRSGADDNDRFGWVTVTVCKRRPTRMIRALLSKERSHMWHACRLQFVITARRRDVLNAA
jgi:hypothetical protein